MMFRFEQLDVWQEAIEYADSVFAGTSNLLDGQWSGLLTNIRQSAVSISSSIATGSSRLSDAVFSRLVEVGYGSLMENVSQLHVATRQGLLRNPSFRDLYRRADQLARQLSEFRSGLSLWPSIVNSQPPNIPC